MTKYETETSDSSVQRSDTIGSAITFERKKVEHLQGRTDIVHEHFKKVFTDPSHAEVLEGIWQRWPWETLHSLPTIDGEGVREVARVQKTMW